MRQFKFRAKHYGGFDDITDLYGFEEDSIHENCESTPVLEYLGIKDKTGTKELCEGDLVRTPTGRLCVIVWRSNLAHCGFDLEAVNCKGTAPNPNRMWEDLEIVGNVIETPELLEE